MRKYIYWPKITAIYKYNSITGKPIGAIAKVAECPNCGNNLYYPDIENPEDMLDNFCSECRWNLHKQPTRWQLFRHWMHWFGDKRCLAMYPLLQVKD